MGGGFWKKMGAQNVHCVFVAVKGIGIKSCYFFWRFFLGDGLFLDFILSRVGLGYVILREMPDVGDIFDVADFVSRILQIAPQNVGRRE